MTGATKYYLKNINWIDAYSDTEAGIRKILTEIQRINGENVVKDKPQPTDFSLVSCPGCGKMISKEASFCPHCGRPLQKTPAPPQTPVPPKDGKSKSKSKKWIWWLIGGIVTLAAIIGVGIALLDNNVPEEWTEIAGDTIEYVDLGLPSGTKWSNYNQTNPNDSHDFYTYDEAVQQFGDQLPTKEQFEELKESCTYVWDESARGCWFYGPNSNRIFLPAAGFRINGTASGVGYNCGYWSSTPYDSEYAWYLYFDCSKVSVDWNYRPQGQSVRLVQD